MAFKCSECGRTWPDRRNQRPALDEPDQCHECADDEDDGREPGPWT